MPNRQIIGGQPYRYGYQGEFAETDPETGKPAFQLRLYDPRLNRWLSPDPMGQYASPYMSMGNNPVSRVDPDGGEDNPVYGANGEGFLGTTESGLQGEAIIMDAANFTQGMSDASALSAGTLFGDLNSFQNFKFMGSNYGHWKGLNQRPDWDGFVTPAEGVTWAKGHPGALQNPTANNSLYINSSLLDFGDVASANLSLGAITPVNLFSSANAKASIGNHTLRATVYALGRVNLKRVHGKLVKVINDDATDYDWNLGGSFKRRAAIRTERFLEGLNDTHGFRAFYYGLGRLNN